MQRRLNWRMAVTLGAFVLPLAGPFGATRAGAASTASTPPHAAYCTASVNQNSLANVADWTVSLPPLTTSDAGQQVPYYEASVNDVGQAVHDAVMARNASPDATLASVWRVATPKFQEELASLRDALAAVHAVARGGTSEDVTRAADDVTAATAFEIQATALLLVHGEPQTLSMCGPWGSALAVTKEVQPVTASTDLPTLVEVKAAAAKSSSGREKVTVASADLSGSLVKEARLAVTTHTYRVFTCIAFSPLSPSLNVERICSR